MRNCCLSYLIPSFRRELFFSHIQHIFELGENVIIARLIGQVLHLPLLGSVFDEQLRINDLKHNH